MNVCNGNGSLSILPIQMLDDDIVLGSFLEMLLAEFSDANACLPYHFFGHGENDPDVVWILEAFAWQTKDTLLSNQGLHEFKFVVKFWKIFDVNADHHVHRAVWHHRAQTICLA